MKTLYLAGPDVFYPDALPRAEKHKAICRLYDFEPLHPLDQQTPLAKAIYRTNIALIKRADAVIANLCPFRGPEVDSGTAFEVGYAIALGKPVVGYIPTAESMMQRVERLYGTVRHCTENDSWRDKNDKLVENFGHPVNLMLAESCSIVVGDLEDALAKLCALGFVDTPIL